MNHIILSCPTLKKELDLLLTEAGSDTPAVYLPSQLHSNPNQLHAFLQSQIALQPEGTEQILLCVSGCGGAARGLKVTTAELVIPKTQDCIDILLSQNSAHNILRTANGIFLTESWMEFFKKSSLDYQAMTAKFGKERAEERLKQIYQGFEHFYIIDTATYDLRPVVDYIQPLIKLLDGTLETIHGNCGVLRKIVSGNLDKDFEIVPKGSVSS